MICYSSAEFSQDWRYAIDRDFTGSDGNPFSYAADGRRQWDDEVHKMSLKHQVGEGCISSDGSRLALRQENDIHIFDTKTWEVAFVLKGHTADIECMKFQPGNSNVLVSSQQRGYVGEKQEAIPECLIIWHLDQAKDTVAPTDEAIGNIVRQTAATASSHLKTIGVDVPEAELQYMEQLFAPHVQYVVSKHIAARKIRIDGRMHSSFQSEAFSPTGKFMTWLPGRSPRANRSDPWDICIGDTETFQTELTLKGHSDSIMWTGWNSDETLFGSVSWDGSIRIWDAGTGEELHRFQTDTQNWTGGFSPDSKYFAATKGTGEVLVYALHGKSFANEHWSYKGEGTQRWKRALDWHPNSKWLAVGGEHSGELLLLDVETKEVLQKRKLSYEACQVDREEKQDIMGGYLGVNRVKFVDGGKKIAFHTFGDGSCEVYDIQDNIKWRFGRGGTDEGPRANKWRDEKGKVTTTGGYDSVIWEDLDNGKVMLASLDGEEVRVWSVEMSRRSDA